MIIFSYLAHFHSALLRLDSMSDAGKCLDVMDDLSFWLDETEIIITTSPNYTDEQSLREALEKVKVCVKAYASDRILD